MIDQTGVRLEVLHTAEIPMPEAYVFRVQGSRLSRLRAGLRTSRGLVRAPCLAFVVRHPSAGVILIDTGLHPDALTKLRKDYGRAMGLFFRSLQPAGEPFDAQLRRRGIEPHEVERVVMTHLHVDHTGGMRLLPNATFVSTPDEVQAARTRFAVIRGYVRHHLPPASRFELVDFGASGRPFGRFAKAIDLLGDGSIRLICTAGHTPGHQSVLLRLDDGRSVLLVGDAAYTLRSISEQILPLFTADDMASVQSLRELKAFSESEPDAILVPTHDPDAWRQLAGAARTESPPAVT
jgi:glyoxylase-like metal-dependent hydrolase (beta-lactamase superfamily II)